MKFYLSLMFFLSSSIVYAYEIKVSSIDCDNRSIPIQIVLPNGFQGAESYPVVVGVSPKGMSESMSAILSKYADEESTIFIFFELPIFNTCALDAANKFADSLFNVSSLFLTGYSLAGKSAVIHALSSTNYKGVVAYAPYFVKSDAKEIDVKQKDLALYIIIGDKDYGFKKLQQIQEMHFNSMKNFHCEIKEGVKHNDEYYDSMPFYLDWKKGMKYIMDSDSKKQ